LNGANGTQGTTGLNGANGTQGSQGVAGQNGTAGVNGTVGANGTAGLNGANGTVGSQGVAGTAGSQGIAGTQGTAGLAGTQGSQGVAGTQGTAGPVVGGTMINNDGLGAGDVATFEVTYDLPVMYVTPGDYVTINTTEPDAAYFLVTSFNMIGSSYFLGIENINGVDATWSAGATWVLVGPIGPSGTQGTAGFAGTQGTVGVSGTAGSTGPQGISGTAGSVGLQGIAGTQGTVGVAGTQGTNGADGTQGTSGVSGTAGSIGPQGQAGTAGSAGVNGTQGTVGVAGTAGTASNAGSGYLYAYNVVVQNSSGGNVFFPIPAVQSGMFLDGTSTIVNFAPGTNGMYLVDFYTNVTGNTMVFEPRLNGAAIPGTSIPGTAGQKSHSFIVQISNSATDQLSIFGTGPFQTINTSGTVGASITVTRLT
jgi:hypothetical protein